MDFEGISPNTSILDAYGSRLSIYYSLFLVLLLLLSSFPKDYRSSFHLLVYRVLLFPCIPPLYNIISLTTALNSSSRRFSLSLSWEGYAFTFICYFSCYDSDSNISPNALVLTYSDYFTLLLLFNLFVLAHLDSSVVRW